MLALSKKNSFRINNIVFCDQGELIMPFVKTFCKSLVFYQGKLIQTFWKKLLTWCCLLWKKSNFGFSIWYCRMKLKTGWQLNDYCYSRLFIWKKPHRSTHGNNFFSIIFPTSSSFCFLEREKIILWFPCNIVQQASERLTGDHHCFRKLREQQITDSFWDGEKTGIRANQLFHCQLNRKTFVQG